MSLFKYVVTFLFAISISFFNLMALADPGNKGHGHGKGHAKSAGKSHGHGKTHAKKAHAKSSKAVKNTKSFKRFSTNDKTVIRNYFDKNPLSATALPPGVAMNLARGKPLPPGIAKRYLPENLVTTLPVYPGYEYLLVGKDAVLVDPTTNVIADVIANVLK
jgi:hypothetical protein